MNSIKSFFIKLKEMRHWRQLNVTLIVSTGRTGTKFLGVKLNQPDENIYSVHEPRPNLEKLGQANWSGKSNKRMVQRAFLKHRVDQRRVAGSQGASLYIESNGGLTFLIDDLYDLLPNLRILHVIRSPLDFIRSGVSRTTPDGLQKYAQENAWLFKSSYNSSDPWFKRWDDLDIYERFAWMWQIKNQHLADWCEAHENGRSFRFEDIFQKGALHDDAIAFASWGHVKRLDINERINRSKVNLADDINTWPKTRIETIHVMTASLSKRFDYPEIKNYL